MDERILNSDNIYRLVVVMLMLGNIIVTSCILYLGIKILVPQGSWMTRVHGESMTPTLEDGQILYVENKKIFEHGDIVTFTYLDPVSMNSSIFIKRIVGLPGDYLKIKEEGVYINGIYYKETYIDKETCRETFGEGNWNEVVLDTNEFYVLGDNRKNSFDSRMFGPVSGESMRYVQSEDFTVNFYIKCLQITLLLGGCFVFSRIVDRRIEKTISREIFSGEV